MDNPAFDRAKDVLALCRTRKFTLATAESCTGGMIAACLTAVPGASEVFRGGVVSYATEIKRLLLGVPASILDTKGPVCAECAKAMADGARTALRADCACSVTGYAGPDGGTPEDPVGTVYFGIATPVRTVAFRFHFDGGRDAVREAVVQRSLSLLQSEISEK